MNCPKCGLPNTGNLAVGLAMPQCLCVWQAPAQSGNWPFPAPGGPVPWTKQQEHEYQNQQRAKLPEAPL